MRLTAKEPGGAELRKQTSSMMNNLEQSLEQFELKMLNTYQESLMMIGMATWLSILILTVCNMVLCNIFLNKQSCNF